MRTLIRKSWPLLIITAFIFVPKYTFAADWVNVGFPDKNIKTVYADPKNNQHIFVTLTSYIDNNYNFYTEDGGNNWQPISFNGAFPSCNNFIVSSENASEVWAGCSPGIYRSTDGGKTFVLASALFRYSQNIQVSMTEAGIIFLTNSANEVWRSYDGIFWEQKIVPGSGTARLFLNKNNEKEVYVSKTGEEGPGLYKSADAGNTWSYTYSAVPIRNGIGQMIFNSSGKICVTAGTYGMGCSLDGGFTWGVFASPNLNKPVEYQHFYRLEQNPDDENNLIVLSGTWGGLDTKIYSYKGNSSIPEILPMANMTGAITISQGVVYSWSQNIGWTKGIWRNDGIAVMPEYLQKHPVIIVPGILGSWYTPKTNKWELDPFKNTYTELYNNFIIAGYEPGKDLFAFPYQWRSDNRETAYLLKQKIDEAKTASGAKKVDIVAHSMGGLVTRIYAQSEEYQNDIDQIVFIGTPQIGSLSSYPMWEAGDLSLVENSLRVYLNILLKEESLQHLYLTDGVLKYIRNEVPSIGQLLPIYSYIEGKSYPNGYPRNELLEILEANKFKIQQSGIRVTNIVGTNSETPTTAEILRGDFGIYWPDGKPINYYFGNGDGTVSLFSQTAVPGDNVYKTNIKHSDLPKMAINDIFEALGVNYTTSEKIEVINKYLFIAAYSPVDFYVIAPDGKKTGFNKNGESFNEIEGAFYAGNESETEFLTIPNPLPGVYRVMTYGTETGSYEIEATYTDDERNISFSSSYVGQAELEKEDGIIVTLSPDTDSIEANIEDKTVPTVVINLNRNILTHWDTLVLSCEVSDEESGVEEFVVKIDGNKVNCEEAINLFEQSLGTHKIEYMAKDKAENVVNGDMHYQIEATYSSTLKDIAWLYLKKHFKNHGDAISLSAQIKLSQFFDSFGRKQKSIDALNRARELIDKLRKKNKISAYGYDMITSDINYILEGK